MAAIGTIYNKSNFTDLSDFDTKGNWELSAGKIISSGGNSVLQDKRASALDEFQLKVRTTSKFLNIQTYGIKAENNIRATFSIENGHAKWQFAYDNSSGTSSASIIIDNGDILEFVITKTQWTVNFQIKNITKNIACDVVATVAITAHKLRFFASAAVDIISIEKTSNQEFEPLNLLVGDSISYGSSASIPANRWGSIAGFSVEGSAGDTSVEALELLYEVTNIIKPKRVIYAMGTNDLDIEAWKTNLQEFKNYINQRNIVFIPITPYANSIRNMTAYQTYIAANFTKYFDLFSVTKQAGNSNLKTEYNSGDNVHPNNAGHQAIGEYVLASPYYTFTPIGTTINNSLFVSALLQWYN